MTISKSQRWTHFIGVGGAGMCGIARVLLQRGETVSGSDLKESPALDHLRTEGATVHVGHSPEWLAGANQVVYSTAVPASNIELTTAIERGLRILHRAAALEELVQGLKGVAVTGAHGKTTTTALVAAMLGAAGLDPTVVVGGFWDGIGGNGKLGGGRYAVYEACESDNSFLNFAPHSAIVLNLDADHLDNHGSIENIRASFRRFCQNVESDGVMVLGTDCDWCGELRGALTRPVVTCGRREDADYRLCDLRVEQGRWQFGVEARGQRLGELSLGIPGEQNAGNALAAAALCLELGVPWEKVAEATAKFTGVARRFTILGEVDGVMVVDDYAHHPAEIRATLAAAKRGWGRRIIAVFQPHLYSRTQLLLEEFGRAFEDADVVIVTDVYGAREHSLPGVTGEMVEQAVRSNGVKSVHYMPELSMVVRGLRTLLRPGDMLITIGAGDVCTVAEELVNGKGRAGPYWVKQAVSAC